MHFSIDVLRTDTPASLAPLWKAAAEAQATKSGFNVAKLHKVYKTLNRDSYDFVSIEQWRDMETCRAAQTTVENLYTIVNEARSATEVSFPGAVIVTNPYRVRLEDAPRYADMWDVSKRHMETREGFIDAYLYQAVDSNSEYLFVSRAEWRSEELFMKQFEGTDFKNIVASFEGIFIICLSHVTDIVQSKVDADAIWRLS